MARRMKSGTMAEPAARQTMAVSRRAYWLAACMLLGSLPAIFARGVPAQVSELRTLAASQPYLHPEYAGLLYLWMPAVALSSFILYISPGIFLTLCFGRLKNVLEQVLSAFGVSVALSVLLEPAGKLVLPASFSDSAYVRWWC